MTDIIDSSITEGIMKLEKRKYHTVRYVTRDDSNFVVAYGTKTKAMAAVALANARGKAYGKDCLAYYEGVHEWHFHKDET